MGLTRHWRLLLSCRDGNRQRRVGALMAQHLDRPVAAAACPVPLAKPPGRPALAGAGVAETRLEDDRLEETGPGVTGPDETRLGETGLPSPACACGLVLLASISALHRR